MYGNETPALIWGTKACSAHCLLLEKLCMVLTTSTMETNCRNPLVRKKIFKGNCTLTVSRELKLMTDRSQICFKSNQSKLSLAV